MLKSKLFKRINHHEVISSCMQALDITLRKDFYEELNRILLKELDIEYSSFFLNAHNSLDLYETNIESEQLKVEIESIVDYKDPDKEDFQSTFDNSEIVLIEKNDTLIYPTAAHRHIRCAMLLPLKNIGYWLLEDPRKFGDDKTTQELAKLSKLLEKLLLCHQRSYIDESLKIYTARSVYEEYREVTKTVCEVEISNLLELIKRYGDEVRVELLELVISQMEKENCLKGAIGITNNDLLIIYSYEHKDKVTKSLGRIVEAVEKLKLTIEHQVVQLKLSYNVQTFER